MQLRQPVPARQRSIAHPAPIYRAFPGNLPGRKQPVGAEIQGFRIRVQNTGRILRSLNSRKQRNLPAILTDAAAAPGRILKPDFEVCRSIAHKHVITLKVPFLHLFFPAAVPPDHVGFPVLRVSVHVLLLHRPAFSCAAQVLPLHMLQPAGRLVQPCPDIPRIVRIERKGRIQGFQQARYIPGVQTGLRLLQQPRLLTLPGRRFGIGQSPCHRILRQRPEHCGIQDRKRPFLVSEIRFIEHQKPAPVMACTDGILA